MLGRMETPLNHFFNDCIDPGTLEALTGGPLAEHLTTGRYRSDDKLMAFLKDL